MNKTLLISYDLGVPEDSSDYKIVIDYIKSLGTWAKPLKSLWLVVSGKSVSDVRTDIKNLTDSNDKILVIDVSDDNWATARISEGVTDWMKENL